MTTSTTENLPLRRRVAWMAGHWTPYRRSVPALLVLTLLNAAVLVVYPWLMGRIVEGVERNLSVRYIVEHAAVLLTLAVLHFGIYFTLQTLRARLNLCFAFGARTRVFEHLLDMGPTFFRRFRTGDVVTRLIDDISEKLAWYMCSGIFRVIEAGSVIVFGVAMMLWINPLLTLYSAGPLPILIGLFVITADRLHQRYAAVQESISELNDSLESCFSGIRVVKAFGAEAAQRRLVTEAVEEQRRAEVRAVRWQTVIDSFYGNVWQLAIVGVLLAGGAMYLRGEVSLGEIITFDVYVLMLVWPMFDVGQFLVRGKLSGVAITRIDELERFEPDVLTARVESLSGPLSPPRGEGWGEGSNDRTPSVPRPPHPNPLPRGRGRGDLLPTRRPRDDAPADHPAPPLPRPGLAVVFDGVSYRYADAETDALADVSFAAQSGRLTAIVGAVGSGKSTALALVPRLMEPTRGRIVIGERELTTWDTVALRSLVGYVPQEAALLSGTVEENIRFGREWITADDLGMAIETARLGEAIDVWPQGLQTVVGSRGLRLSGGQKQRVALARALAGRPSVLLLDDCTSALDAETEEAVWQHLLREIPGCTTLLVTHRTATLRRADRIIVLDRGRPLETGDFQDLNRRGTQFHRLYRQWKFQEDVEE